MEEQSEGGLKGRQDWSMWRWNCACLDCDRGHTKLHMMNLHRTKHTHTHTNECTQTGGNPSPLGGLNSRRCPGDDAGVELCNMCPEGGDARRLEHP